MNEFNKNNVKWGLNCLLLFIWAILTIATCCVIWNFVPMLAGKLAAVALFVFNGAAIIEKGKRLSKKE